METAACWMAMKQLQTVNASFIRTSMFLWIESIPTARLIMEKISGSLCGEMNWMDSNTSMDHVQDFGTTIVPAVQELLYHHTATTQYWQSVPVYDIQCVATALNIVASFTIARQELQTIQSLQRCRRPLQTWPQGCSFIWIPLLVRWPCRHNRTIIAISGYETSDACVSINESIVKKNIFTITHWTSSWTP
jgi:hypothetical protein